MKETSYTSKPQSSTNKPQMYKQTKTISLKDYKQNERIAKENKKYFSFKKLQNIFSDGNKEDIYHGWNGVFHRCADVLQTNPSGIVYLMNNFNACNIGMVITCWIISYTLYLNQVLFLSPIWMFSWLSIRIVFSVIFPVLPHMNKYFASQLISKYPSLSKCKFSRLLPNPDLQTISSVLNQKIEQEYHMVGEFSDESIIRNKFQSFASFLAWMRVRKSLLKKYGLANDVSENLTTIGLTFILVNGLPIIGVDDMILSFMNYCRIENVFDIYGPLFSCYALSAWITRISSVVTFRYISLPLAENKVKHWDNPF